MTPRMTKTEQPTFIEAARRKQIIDAALLTIAEQGYSQTSFSEIARELGITKGLIAYHFDGKQDLITSAIHTILNQQGVYIKKYVDMQAQATEKLRAYIEASFEYIEENRAHFVALVDLWGSFTSPEEKRAFSEKAYDPCRAHLQKIFRIGCEHGQFSAFDQQAMSAIIQGSIDGVMLQWVFDPQAVDLRTAAHEMAQMFLGRVTKA